MSKTYTFEDPIYTVEVPVTTAVCAVAIFYCAWHAVVGDLLSPALMLFFMVAAIYQVWNVLVSAAYPKHVVVDDESISFVSMTRTDRYVLSEIKNLYLRANARNGRLFIRIDDPTIFRGRYWVNTQDFTDGRELFEFVVDLECKVNPEGLRARARRNNEEYLALQEKKRRKEEGELESISNKDKKKKGARSREAALGTKAEKE